MDRSQRAGDGVATDSGRGDAASPSSIGGYRLVSELGRDESGILYRAVEQAIGRTVALRVLPADDSASQRAEERREQFRRAAQLAAKVNHPAFPTLHAFGALPEGAYAAYEFVEGESLQHLLEKGGRWWPGGAARLLATISEGMAAAHAAGVVHGNLSAANVRVYGDGSVKILDLGLTQAGLKERRFSVPGSAAATSLDPATASDDATSLDHASSLDDEPEEAELVDGRLHPAADVRSIGLMGLQLLSGAHEAEDELPDDGEESSYTRASEAAGEERLGILQPILARIFAGHGKGSFRDAGELHRALERAIEGSERRVGLAGAREGSAAPGRTGGLRQGRGKDAAQPAEPAYPLPPVTPWAVPLTAEAMADRPVLLPEPRGPVGETYLNSVGRIRSRSPSLSLGSLGEEGLRKPVALALLLALFIGGVAIAYLTAQGRQRLAVSARAGSAAELSPFLIESENEQIGVLPASTSGRPGPAGTAPVGVAGGEATEDPPAETGPQTAAAMVRSVVTASPQGTRIRVIGQDATWTDRAELSIPEGDSVFLQFSREGYRPQIAVAKGGPLEVRLQPDSVTVAFQSNVAARVYVAPAGQPDASPRLLGRTGGSARLATGSYRIIYRVADQPDWEEVRAFTTPGESYRVAKTDYPTAGSVVASVDGTWARVSLDGGPEQETPFSFRNVSPGRHVLRVTRQGYATIVDTVTVRPGQAVNRRYTLRPAQ